MKTLPWFIRYLLIWTLAALSATPGLSWSHVALTYPQNLVESCRDKGNYNWPEDGSGIAKGPCHDQAMVYGSSSERWYPFSHWHEFNANVPGYENFENVKKAVPDEKLCSAGDPRKRSFDLALDWERTTVPVVNGKITINISGTQPHVPAYAKIFITSPGYQANKPLKWSDLTLIATENFDNYRTDWNNSILKQEPTTTPKTLGFFEFQVSVPNGQTGPATIYMYFQRLDTGLEAFFTCAVVKLGGDTSIPSPWISKGALITPDMVPKVNESVRLRVFDGSNKKFSEIVDESLKITAQNVRPNQWLSELAGLLRKHSNIIQIGKESGSNIVLDPSDPVGNHMYVSKNDYSVQASITNDGGPPPTPTVQINGPSELKSDESYTFSSTLSNFQSKFQGFSWAPEGIIANDLNAPRVTGRTVTVTTPQKFFVRVNVRDGEFGSTYQATKQITIVPKDGGGGEYPQWIRDGGYNSGAKVSNYGTNYVCKSGGAGAWCGQNENEPGKPGSEFWQRAWDPVP